MNVSIEIPIWLSLLYLKIYTLNYVFQKYVKSVNDLELHASFQLGFCQLLSPVQTAQFWSSFALYVSSCQATVFVCDQTESGKAFCCLHIG